MMCSRWSFRLAFILFLLTGCSKDDLTRDRAEQLLAEANKQSFEQFSRLNPLFAGKPEFLDLQNSVLCDVEPIVTGIRKVTETQMVVEWEQITTARPDSLKKWLRAFNELEQRLSDLKGERYSDLFYISVYFTDSIDGQQFKLVQEKSAGKSINIKNTDQWRRIQSLKEYVESLLKEGTLTSKATETAFWLYDDGWRIGK